MTIIYSELPKFAKALNIDTLLDEKLQIVAVEGEDPLYSLDNCVIPAYLAISFSDRTPELLQRLTATLKQLKVDVDDKSFEDAQSPGFFNLAYNEKNANVLCIQGQGNILRLFEAATLCKAKEKTVESEALSALSKSRLSFYPSKEKAHGWITYSSRGDSFIKSNATGKIFRP